MSEKKQTHKDFLAGVLALETLLLLHLLTKYLKAKKENRTPQLPQLTDEDILFKNIEQQWGMEDQINWPDVYRLCKDYLSQPWYNKYKSQVLNIYRQLLGKMPFTSYISKIIVEDSTLVSQLNQAQSSSPGKVKVEFKDSVGANVIPTTASIVGFSSAAGKFSIFFDEEDDAPRSERVDPADRGPFTITVAILDYQDNSLYSFTGEVPIAESEDAMHKIFYSGDERGSFGYPVDGFYVGMISPDYELAEYD